MATTKIWKVKGWIGQVVHYVENPDKTTNPDFNEADLQSLRDVMNYATQDYKTEQQQYVSGINCSPDIARQQMIMTKKRYGKEGGITAFHGYQSFAPGEVTPDLAHEIGMKLANELWGDRFEVIIATHLDKEHIHCHFVLNSVSFKDGKKYNDCKSTYKLMRETSDRLCREYGLSVIENPPKGKHKSYDIWQAEKAGKPTWHNVIRKDIDDAILHSFSFSTFIICLKNKGYEVKQGKYVSIRPIGKERFVRLKTLGQDYTEEAIKSRVHSTPLLFMDKPAKPAIKRYKLKGSLKNTKKITGFRALYLHYMYLLGKIPKKRNRCPNTPYMRAELIKFEQYKEQFKFLAEQKIDTMEQLTAFISETETKISNFTEKRTEINDNLRHILSDSQTGELKAQHLDLNKDIVAFRKNLKIAYRTKECTKIIRGNIVLRHKSKNRTIKQKHKHKYINKEHRII